MIRLNSKSIKLVFAGAFLLLLTSGCEKSDDASSGTSKTGNANISTRTFSVSSWLYQSPYHYVNLNVPELNASNNNIAGALVYFSTDGAIWNALPYTQYGSTGNYFMGFNTRYNNVQITWFYNGIGSGDTPNEYYKSNVNYKVVIIPPAERIAKPNIDYKDYNQVKVNFNLND